MGELPQHLDYDFPLMVPFGDGFLTPIECLVQGGRIAVDGRLERQTS